MWSWTRVSAYKQQYNKHNREYNLYTEEEHLQLYKPGYGVGLGFGATNSNNKYNSEQWIETIYKQKNNY